MDYKCVQFLTGHSFFRSYLFRMSEDVSPNSTYCLGTPDEAEEGQVDL